MDIISEPEYTEEEVVEVDINFIGGEPLRVSLKPGLGDSIEDAPEYVRITVPRIGIVATAERRNITHSDIKKHLVKRYKKQPEPTVPARTRSERDPEWRPSPLSIGPVGRLGQDEDES